MKVAAEALGGRAYAPAKAHAERLRAWFRYGPIPKNFNHKLAEAEGNAGEEITAKDTKSAKEESGKNIAFLFEGRKGNNAGIWEEFLIGRAQVLYADCADGSGSERIRRRMELLRRALADAGNGFFVYIGEGSVPVRPLADLLRLLEIDGRSRFAWEDAGVAPHTAIPSSLVARHSPWLLLNREAAALLVEDDFSEYFADVAGDADWCYEGTNYFASLIFFPPTQRADNSGIDAFWKCVQLHFHEHANLPARGQPLNVRPTHSISCPKSKPS